jgi:hypothetical protein
MNNKHLENMIDDEIIAYKEEEEDTLEEEGDAEEESSVNIPLSGSPLYPRIYVGDSAKPLQGQFHESEYVDDNISRTWTGLLTSFYG